jgi:molybdate transport system permease protein
MHQPQNNTGRAVVWSVGLIALLFLALPIGTLVLRGIGSNSWQELFDGAVMDAIVLSLITTVQSTLLTLFFGTPLAYLLARYHFPFKRWVNLLVELPIVLPPAVAGLALLVTFGRRGLLGPALNLFGISLPFTTTAVIVAQTFVSAPFYIRSATVGFVSIPKDLEDAARVDGASESGVFWFITLPLAGQALSAGLVLSWARALGEFGATILFAGSLQGVSQTMPLLVYNVLERDIDAAIFTGILLIGLAIIALIIAQGLQLRNRQE